jgi:hypothetical protein
MDTKSSNCPYSSLYGFSTFPDFLAQACWAPSASGCLTSLPGCLLWPPSRPFQSPPSLPAFQVHSSLCAQGCAASSDTCHQDTALFAQVCSPCSLSLTALCSRVLALFPVSDYIVLRSLAPGSCWRPGGRGLQIAIEDIHSKMYLLLSLGLLGDTRSNSRWGPVAACVREEEGGHLGLLPCLRSGNH